MDKNGWTPTTIRSKRLHRGYLLAVLKASDWWTDAHNISRSMPTDYVVGQYHYDGKGANGYSLKITRGQCQDKTDALLLFDAITSTI